MESKETEGGFAVTEAGEPHDHDQLGLADSSPMHVARQKAPWEMQRVVMPFPIANETLDRAMNSGLHVQTCPVILYKFPEIAAVGQRYVHRG